MSTPSLKSVRRLALERCFEFVAPCIPLGKFHGTLPIEPGAVLRDNAGLARVLHFAPRRWLVPAPAEPLYRELARRDAVGDGALVDVECKWQWLRLEGPQATRILESSVSVEGLLCNRSCAAGSVFDCPVVLGRDGEIFDCWVMSSYAQTFLRAIGQLPLVADSKAPSQVNGTFEFIE
jgi:heterotetrameric sarcosine oxidase gamma subunit